MFPYIAGAEMQALALARTLQSRGMSVQIVTTAYARNLPPTEMVDGVPIQRVVTAPRWQKGQVAVSGPSVAPTKVLQLTIMAAHIARMARSFDIVHAHCVSMSSLGAALGARAAGVPVVLKPSLGGPDGEIQKVTRSAATRMLLPALRGIDRYAVLDSQIEADLLGAGVAQNRCIRVHNGIDLARFAPPSPEQRDFERTRLGVADGPVALFAGQLIPRKGVEPLLDAWRRVRRAVPQARLLVAGTGELSHMAERMASDPDSGVAFLGVREDVHTLMHAADLLVLPSLNESFGNVIVEAMASQLPVVVARTGVAAQIDLDNKAGLIVDPRSDESIASALVALLSSPERSQRFGRMGRSLVGQFDFSKVADEYVALYDSIRTT